MSENTTSSPSLLSAVTAAKVEKAFSLWRESYGKTIGFFGDTWTLESIASDPDGAVLVALELSRLVTEAAANVTFTAEEMLRDSAGVAAKMEALRFIQSVANEPEIQGLLAECRQTLRAAATQVGAGGRIEETLANESIGHLIRTAQAQFRSLRAHQYAQGGSRREQFCLNEWIYAFRSMHELVEALARQPVDGLTLCVVVDPSIAEYSVFAWALKTGATLTILSESNGLSHREQKHSRRNPGRDFERRSSGSFYPYSIFDFKETKTASGSGSQLRISGMFKDGKAPSGKSTALKLHDVASHRVRLVRDLEPAEITWLLLIANLIHREYWLTQKRLPELSYTGEMTTSPDAVPLALTQAGEGGLLLTGVNEPLQVQIAEDYQPLALKPVAADVLKQEGEKGENWGGPSDVGGRTGRNDWMVHRYENNVAVENLLPLPKNQRALLPAGKNPGALALSMDGAVTTKSKFIEARSWAGGAMGYSLASFDPSGLYGTKSEIERERFFAARTNQKAAIQALADREYAERAPEIVTWFQDRVRANARALKEAIARGKCEIPTLMPAETKSGESSFHNRTETRLMNILSRYSVNPADEEPHYSIGLSQRTASLHNGITKKASWSWKCVEENDTNANAFAVFQPIDSAGLAFLAGVKVDDLPEPLQHWRTENRPLGYVGNFILDLIDPVENMRNPWTRLTFAVDVRFARRTYQRWVKGEFRDAEFKVTNYPELPLTEFVGRA